MGYDEDDYGEEINDQQLKKLAHDPAMTALTAMPLEETNNANMNPTPEQMEAMENYDLQQ